MNALTVPPEFLDQLAELVAAKVAARLVQPEADEGWLTARIRAFWRLRRAPTARLTSMPSRRSETALEHET
jgi:hypothetical protein